MQSKKAFSKMFWGLTAGQLAVQVGAVLLMVPFVVAAMFGEGGDIEKIMPYAQLLTVLFIPAFWIFTRKLPRYIPEKKGRMSIGDILGWLCVALTASELLGAASNYLLEGIYAVCGIENPASSMDSFMGTLGIWGQLALIAVLAPVVEEIVFRKLMFERVRPYGDKVAVIVTAVAFGMFHGNIAQIPYATTAGLVLGYVMLKTNNLIYPILIHFLNNLISVALSHAMSFEDARIDGIVALVSAVYIAFGLVFFIKKHRRGFGDFHELRNSPITGRVVFGNAGAIVFIIITCMSAGSVLLMPFLSELISKLQNSLPV